MEVDWEKEVKSKPVAEVDQKHRSLDISKEDFSKLSEFQVRQIGALDQDALEAMLVGYLVDDPIVKNKQLTGVKNAEAIANSGMKGASFENKIYGQIFDELLSYYRATRRLLTRDEIGEDLMSRGISQEQAMMCQTVVAKCRGAIISRRLGVDILINRMKRITMVKESDKVLKEFINQRNNPDIGIEKAIDQLKTSVIKKLNISVESVIREYDLISDYEKDVFWMVDMKKNPEKYRGCACGIKVIDDKTTGFKPGHLTVFVGKHGGYKTTVMMNVGFGLWERGKNVLFVSLEMEEKLVKGKLWCRGTKTVPWSRISKGIITGPEDWADFEYLSQKVKDESLAPEEKKNFEERLALLQLGLYGDPVYKVEKGKEDTVRIKEFYDKAKTRPNKFKIINVGQSQKITVSQIEKYIEEHLEDFQPDVVIVDYLALVASDVPYPDRRDLEVGDVCKYFRKMGERLGFSVVTAAQFKRSAIERIRKYGFSNPEKAALGTDDIAESNQIGADADTVFMLWLEDAGNRIKIFTPKARHGIPDVEKGEVVGVRQEICMIADDIGDTVAVSDDVSIFDGLESAKRLAEGKKLASDLPEEGWTDDSVVGISGVDDLLTEEDDLGL